MADFYVYFPKPPFEKSSPHYERVSSFLTHQCNHFIVAHEFWNEGIFMRTQGVASAGDLKKKLLSLADDAEPWEVAEIEIPPEPFVDLVQKLYNPPPKQQPPAPQKASEAVPRFEEPKDLSQDPLSRLVGIDPVLREFRKMAKTVAANQFENAHCGTAIETNMNIMVAAAPGAGGSKIAEEFAAFLAYAGLAGGGQEPLHVQMMSLISAAETERNVLKMLKEAGTRVVLLDQIDSLLEVYSYGDSALNTLGKAMGPGPGKPVIVASCYEQNYRELMRKAPGLKRGFGKTFYLNGLSDESLVKIFAERLRVAKLACKDSRVFSDVKDLLVLGREKRGQKSSTIYDIEEIFRALLDQKADRQGVAREEMRKAVERGAEIGPDKQREQRIVTREDVPIYSGAQRGFVAKEPAPKAAAPEAPRPKVLEMRREAKCNVIAFPHK